MLSTVAAFDLSGIIMTDDAIKETKGIVEIIALNADLNVDEKFMKNLLKMIKTRTAKNITDALR